MSRTLVIGDIHGALRALEQVLARAALTNEDKLIFLGDYVDGWSESSGVINYLLQLQAQQSCIFIKGNHDAWCQEWLRSGDGNSSWLTHGGLETIKSYEGLEDAARIAHQQLLEQMPYYYMDDQNRLFIHAGFTSMNGPKKEFRRPAFSWDRTLWETALGLDPNIKKESTYYPRRLRLFEEIYIGHTPTLHHEKVEPMLAANVWNVDTGAAFEGKLSIMNVDTKEFWQSDHVPQLYPGETGRQFNR